MANELIQLFIAGGIGTRRTKFEEKFNSIRWSSKNLLNY